MFIALNWIYFLFSWYRLFAGAAERNSGAIGEILKREWENITNLSDGGDVKLLEVASGSGQHAEKLQPFLGNVLWQPSDPVEEARVSCAARGAGNSKILEPIDFDATKSNDHVPSSSYHLCLCINMLHISPKTSTEGLAKEASRVLVPKGYLFIYGPFAVGGKISPESNVTFDAKLKSTNPEWGLRDISTVQEACEKHGLALFKDPVPMPANNYFLLFQKI